jgi:tryptophan-rich sensory protein
MGGIFMKRYKPLLIALAIPLAVGGLGALLAGGMSDYGAMVKPPLSPPGWVFPVVWSILYLLMGLASWRVWKGDATMDQKRKALGLYAAQLLLNLLWPIVFFRWQRFLAALILLIGLWVLIFLTIRAFSKVDEKAADLLIPYLLWVSFAVYLNFGIFLLN